MTYQLWDTVAGSAVGGIDTEEAAMVIVRSAFQQFGAEDVRDLILFVVDDERKLHPIANGDELLARVSGVRV